MLSVAGERWGVWSGDDCVVRVATEEWKRDKKS
jgi:hypothetical protein